MKKCPEYKAHPSVVSIIMPDPTKKEIMAGETLSKGCKTHLNQYIAEHIHESKTDIKNKYMDKGNIMEDDAIDLTAEYNNAGMYQKNLETFENKFFIGTPDVVTDKMIIDTKCSWESKTFPLLATELPDPNYADQVLCYMDLTGRKKGMVAYCLLDTPIHLIKADAWSYCRRNGFEELDEKTLDRYIKNMTYEGIPRKFRIKTFDIPFDELRIDAIHNKVIECRKYVQQKWAVLMAQPDF